MTIFDIPFGLQCVVLVLSQLSLIAFKVWHIQLIEDSTQPMIKNMVALFMIQALWLITSALGIKSLIDGNYLLSGLYILGGCIGGIIPLLKQKRRFV